jgi:hypothetical protein
MQKTMKYYSGYVDLDYKSKYDRQLYIGKYFSIYFGTPRKVFASPVFTDIPKDVRGKCEEAIIQTDSFESAVKVLELISAALTLIKAELYEADPLGILPFSAIEKKRIAKEVMVDDEIIGTHVCAVSQILRSCQIACNASFKRAYYNALFKYQLGNYLYSINTVELDPTRSFYYKLSRFASDYTRFAYAIIAFYSVIEELGFEVKADSDNPSFIDGSWNPCVKEDLEKRLMRAGINIEEPFSWSLRSTPTKIERELRKQGRLRPIKKSSWAKRNVRDSEVSLVNAILLVSNLRSKISSHKFTKLVESLSIYDVSNANFLARRLLLESLGFWKQ